MKQILVIASDMRIARHEAEFIAYKMAEPREWRQTYSELRSHDRSVGIFCADPGEIAVQQSVGFDLNEVVIVGDYLRWRVPHPGDFANLGQFIDGAVARGARRRWL